MGNKLGCLIVANILTLVVLLYSHTQRFNCVCQYVRPTGLLEPSINYHHCLWMHTTFNWFPLLSRFVTKLYINNIEFSNDPIYLQTDFGGILAPSKLTVGSILRNHWLVKPAGIMIFSYTFKSILSAISICKFYFSPTKLFGNCCQINLSVICWKNMFFIYLQMYFLLVI